MLESSKLYLISGFFWQEVSGLNVAFAPIEGAVAVIEKDTAPFHFGGVFWDRGDGHFFGQMTDVHGQSELYDISLTKDFLRFKKLYLRYRGERLYAFDYILESQADGTWKGAYELVTGISGPVRGTLTTVARETVKEDAARFRRQWEAKGRKQ